MNTFILYLSSIFGISSTYFLKRKFEMNTVRASSISIVAACCLQFLLTKAFPSQAILFKISAIACGASFCGMSSSKILKNWIWVIACGLAYAWIFITSASAFKGIGGSLGSGACLSVMACYGLMILAETIKKAILDKYGIKKTVTNRN